MNKIRLSKSIVGDEEKTALARVIDNGYLGMGEEVLHFEQEIRDYLETDKDVICVNTGTAALHLSLQAIGVGPGDEVLVPSITYVATYQAVSATGAKPIACDVTRDTVFIDINDAEHRLSAKTKAIIPVHYASSLEGINKVYRFAEKHNLRVIEDAAHSFGSRFHGKPVGSFGDITCFSFDGIKNITSGEGGAVVTGDKLVAQKIKDARLLGVEKDTEKRFQGKRSWSFNVNNQGWRYHMSNLMAAIGREQLKKIDMFSERRVEIAKRYLLDLSEVSDIVFLDIDYNSVVPHIFPVRVLRDKRPKLISVLAEYGIETGIHYQPNHYLSKYYSNYTLPATEAIWNELLSLPMHPDITDDQQEHIIISIKTALKD